jgi:hypothetical protein
MGNYWIGLHRILYEPFTWSDSSALVYTNWKEGTLPKHTRGFIDCVYVDNSGKWAIADCKNNKTFVCKKGDSPNLIQFILVGLQQEKKF